MVSLIDDYNYLLWVIEAGYNLSWYLMIMAIYWGSTISDDKMLWLKDSNIETDSCLMNKAPVQDIKVGAFLGSVY